MPEPDPATRRRGPVSRACAGAARRQRQAQREAEGDGPPNTVPHNRSSLRTGPTRPNAPPLRTRLAAEEDACSGRGRPAAERWDVALSITAGGARLRSPRVARGVTSVSPRCLAGWPVRGDRREVQMIWCPAKRPRSPPAAPPCASPTRRRSRQWNEAIISGRCPRWASSHGRTAGPCCPGGASSAPARADPGLGARA